MCGLESVRGAPPPHNSAVVSSPDSDSAQDAEVSLTAPNGETLRAGSVGHSWVLGILRVGYSEHAVGCGGM